ncbi:MAG: hypothetical protein GEV28_18685 [Actinophytocola sp.]|uniref:hypothetical protein n=1 Tax=Actinophytocola sp. TaxID=1872138 RepID=UPI001323B07A|nr:hypothetical protein [Actinophytocola sp.]MPZ82309.1 hypothetical protein [Actinophytocola sp.]
MDRYGDKTEKRKEKGKEKGDPLDPAQEPAVDRGALREMERAAKETIAEANVEIDQAKMDIARTTDQIRSATSQLETAQYDEASYWEDKDPGSTERGSHKTFTASTSFWMGKDWTPEEKRKLRAIRVALVGGTLTVGTIVASSLNVASASHGVDAADARFNADNNTVNDELAATAEYGFDSAVTALYNSAYTYCAVVLGGVVMYYDTCAKHAENIKALNEPEAGKRRETADKYLQALQRRLAAEMERLNTALAARAEARRLRAEARDAIKALDGQSSRQ